MARAIVVLLALWLGALVQAQEYRPFCQVRCGDGSVGSGTLVDENEGRGLVITNHHVIRGVLGARGKITCWFTSTDERMEASILKADSRYDLAALVVNAPNIKPIQLAAYTGEGRYFVWGYPHAGPLRYVTGLIASDNRSVFRPGDYYVAELTA